MRLRKQRDRGELSAHEAATPAHSRRPEDMAEPFEEVPLAEEEEDDKSDGEDLQAIRRRDRVAGDAMSLALYAPCRSRLRRSIRRPRAARSSQERVSSSNGVCSSSPMIVSTTLCSS